MGSNIATVLNTGWDYSIMVSKIVPSSGVGGKKARVRVLNLVAYAGPSIAVERCPGIREVIEYLSRTEWASQRYPW